MSDLFISYSRKDSTQAEWLAQALEAAGISCWIDKHGLEVASQWSREIVQAINECSAFVVLLSPNSIESHNVVKEVSLASEKRKKILPLELEPVTLTEDFEYPLAGIQRAPIEDIDAVLRALRRFGLEATSGVTLPKAKRVSDTRKSLMILPFEDLSPEADNGWFADGIASELISALTKVSAIRVADQQATKEFKRYRGQLSIYAREMHIGYFVQGDVRKFGDQIKITSRLLDATTSDVLWQDSMRGTMSDIFEIQETVAAKVVEGMHVILSAIEKEKLAARGTANTEAYELWMRAVAYTSRNSREGYELSAKVSADAIALDPTYARAYVVRATALAQLSRVYGGNRELHDEALMLLQEALRLDPTLGEAYAPMAVILLQQGKPKEAERAANEAVLRAPERHETHFVLGLIYAETHQFELAIAPYEAAIACKPDHINTYYNLCVAAQGAHRSDKCLYWASIAVPIYQKHLKLFPDDDHARANLVGLLRWADRKDEAKEVAHQLRHLTNPLSLYNLASVWCSLGEFSIALATFKRSLQLGFRWMTGVSAFLYEEKEGVAHLKGTPEWEEARLMVEAIEREQHEAAESVKS